MSSIPQAIDWFDVPDVVATTVSRRWEEIQPQNFIDGINSNLIFDIDAKDTEFTSLNHELSMTLSLYDKKTGTALGKEYPVAPINLAPLTMFETANYYIGSKQVFGGNRLWPYYTYLTHEYVYSDGAKNSWLQQAFVRARDTTGHFNSLETDEKAANNAGFVQRNDWFVSGRKVHCRVPLNFDISRSGKLLPSGVTTRVELNRAPMSFALMSDATVANVEPVLKIENPVLHVERVKLQPEIVSALRHKIESGSSCKYVYDRILMTNPTSVAIGSTSFTHKITTGQAPFAVFAFFVDAKGLRGSMANNPFLFEHLDVTEASCIFNGETFPARPYSPKFDGLTGTDYNCTNMYTDFMRMLGYWRSDRGNDITLNEYAHDMVVFPFQLSHEPKPENHGIPVNQGSLTLDFKFKEPMKIEKLLITACFMQSSAYVGRGGSCWTSFVNNTAVDTFIPGVG